MPQNTHQVFFETPGTPPTRRRTKEIFRPNAGGEGRRHISGRGSGELGDSRTFRSANQPTQNRPKVSRTISRTKNRRKFRRFFAPRIDPKTGRRSGIFQNRKSILKIPDPHWIFLRKSSGKSQPTTKTDTTGKPILQIAKLAYLWWQSL